MNRAEVLGKLYYETLFKFHVMAVAEGYAELGNCPTEKVLDFIFEQSTNLYHAMLEAQQAVVIDKETPAQSPADKLDLRQFGEHGFVAQVYRQKIGGTQEETFIEIGLTNGRYVLLVDESEILLRNLQGAVEFLRSSQLTEKTVADNDRRDNDA